ncbi:anti-phage dCTP deaminase [Brucella cytisi]|uniref:anti-phage dCTP deaminase n=1 Tax=Brucella cytisi TaxID=407152 RepID=UPI0035D7BCD1
MNTISEFRPVATEPEIVIGLVSPVGTDLQLIIRGLEKIFTDFKYNFHHIKITDRFEEIAKEMEYPGIPVERKSIRTEKFIEFGNCLRGVYGNDFLSRLAVWEIVEKRLSAGEGKKEKYSRNVFVINQLKTQGELELLRRCYGDAFFQISVYSARDIRVDHLAKTIAHQENKRDSNPFRDKAEHLVNVDENENKANGQEVGEIFQLADYVVNVDRDSIQSVSSQVERFVRLLFSSNAISPNRFEYGMYLAHSAALRSLDLSRQVGAAVFRSSGEVATLGANEVPKAGGGTYWCDDPYDAREYMLGHDSNDIRKSELLNEVIDILSPQSELSDDQKRRLKESQFMDALEYGRIVHAEMNALSDAARLGIELKNGILYCTTFPCHMCAKHIVASGIAKVVFLEPYPKSLTADMHSDSVRIEGASRGKYSQFPASEFIPFYGVTPRRYREFFYRKKRKEKGKFLEYGSTGPRVIFTASEPLYGDTESFILKNLFRRSSPD